MRKYEKLNELLARKRTVKIPFPALGLVDESAIKLRSATPSNDASKQIDGGRLVRRIWAPKYRRRSLGRLESLS